MTKGQQSFPWLTYVILLVLIMLFTLSPVIALGFLNAGNSDTPLQLTDLMASWGVLGWLVITPFPIGAMALGAWLIALVVHLLVRRRQARRAEP
jgi:hypothetical protein